MSFDNYHYVLGLMSGTSLDGLDLCYVCFEKSNQYKFKILHTKTITYDSGWGKKLKESIFLNKKNLKILNIEYSNLIGVYINEFIKEFSIARVDFVSSHGHTIFHEPNKGFTYQIGDGKIISEKTQINVVSNFRVQDVQYKGQGAPLVPIGDLLLFKDYKYCINLGGFSNISIKNHGNIKAFDICPVNTVLNYYSNKLGHSCDVNGQLSKKGNINLELLDKLNKINFYKKTGPKSLGIEFVKSEVLPITNSYYLDPKDILKTYIEHITDQISKCISDNNEKVLMTGGGVYNRTLINSLKKKTKTKLIIPKKETIDYKEALIFAFIGLLKIKDEVNCLKSVTGAIKNHSSGEIFRI